MTAFLAELHRGVLDKRHTLDREETIIGRDLQAHIRVDDGSVSRAHAAIYRRGDRYFIRDLGSRNGTTVNEQHLSANRERELQVNDCIFLGKAVLCFLIAEERMSQSLAPEIDPKTGLPNQRSFLDDLDRAMQKSRADHRPVGLLLVGIDDLHGINEQFNTEMGDAVLRQVANRLTSGLRPPETAGRVRGGVFGVIAPDLLDGLLLERSETLRTRIEQATARPGEHPVVVNVSIGAAAMAGLDRDRLFEAADVALSRAKRRGSSVERASRDAAAETDRFQRRMVPPQVFEQWFKPPAVAFTVRLWGVELFGGRQSPIDVDLQATVQQNLSGDELATYPEAGGSVLVTVPRADEKRVPKLCDAIKAGFERSLAQRGQAPISLSFTLPAPVDSAAAAVALLKR